MSEEEINEALKIIKEPITVNSIEYKYFNQENYEKLLSVYENAKWFVSNWEQALQNIKVKNERIKEEQQEKERYIKFYNGLNIWNKNLQQKVDQLENIRKEITKYAQDLLLYDNESLEFKIGNDLLNILNKGSDEK